MSWQRVGVLIQLVMLGAFAAGALSQTIVDRWYPIGWIAGSIFGFGCALSIFGPKRRAPDMPQKRSKSA